jgi:hypothetical protein
VVEVIGFHRPLQLAVHLIDLLSLLF